MDGLPPPAAPNRAQTATRRRDRHGRGMRTPLIPAHLPGFRSRADHFDSAVMQVVGQLERRWPEQLPHIEFAVDDVPSIPPGSIPSMTEAVVDAGVPLTRFHAPGVDARGRATKARIVVYRRPLEMRALGASDLVDLVADVITEQLVAVLGDGNP